MGALVSCLCLSHHFVHVIPNLACTLQGVVIAGVVDLLRELVALVVVVAGS